MLKERMELETSNAFGYPSRVILSSFSINPHNENAKETVYINPHWSRTTAH